LQLTLPHDPVCTTSGKCGCLANGIATTLIVLPLASAPAHPAVLAAPAVARALSRRLIAIDGIGVEPAAQLQVKSNVKTPEPPPRARHLGRAKHRPAQVG
jgi:hypothetical protein